MAAGVLSLVCQAMINNSLTATNACCSLWLLACPDAKKVEIARQAGIDAVIKALVNHRGAEKVQWQGCGALRSLAVNADNEMEIARLASKPRFPW